MPDVIYTEKCTGCRACEVACSYHHRKFFSRKNATSIEVRRRPQEGAFAIGIYKQAEKLHVPCDCAEGSEFCLNYCPEMARDELKSIIRGGSRR